MDAPAVAAYSRREQTGWYFYDWANSAFYTTVVTLLFGPYLNSLAKAAADPRGYVYPLGIPVYAPSFWGYVSALSVAFQVLLLPLVGAFADYSRSKKLLLGVFAYIGAATAMAMFFLEGGSYLMGGGLFLVANLAFGASIVVYNSFLPDIAPPEQRDAVSSKGWGIGYLGGGLLLALNLLLMQKAGALGLSEAQAVRISLWSAGAWWALFTVIPLRALRNRQPARRLPPGQSYAAAGFRQLAHTLRGIRGYPQSLLFLLAYLLYNDAIQTVILFSSAFGNDELKMSMASLALAFLMVQFVAFGGALGFNLVARWIGAKRAIMTTLVVWSAVLVYTYLFVWTAAQYFVLSAVVAIILGGSQALSRSVYSQLIPKGREAEYFGLYEATDRGTSWLGPLVFGLVLQRTHSYRHAIVFLIVFFIAGLILLARVDVARGAVEAQREG